MPDSPDQNPVGRGLIREAFEVDSRVPRTLGLLFFVPGRLSAEFSRNRRARFLSPTNPNSRR
ncbi:MAG: DUF3667 domain-containing protein [Gemmatimonadetes bacterium]|nr:DUF3667 domain-containing protein [Gemmatimonadota bacterium]